MSNENDSIQFKHYSAFDDTNIDNKERIKLQRKFSTKENDDKTKPLLEGKYLSLTNQDKLNGAVKKDEHKSSKTVVNLKLSFIMEFKQFFNLKKFGKVVEKNSKVKIYKKIFAKILMPPFRNVKRNVDTNFIMPKGSFFDTLDEKIQQMEYQKKIKRMIIIASLLIIIVVIVFLVIYLIIKNL